MMRAHAKRLRRMLVERFLDGQHRLARREPRPIADAENMRIDGKGLSPEGGVQHDVRGLATDAGKCLQGSPVGRDLAVMVAHKNF